MSRPTLSIAAAKNGRPRTPQSWVETVPIQRRDGTTAWETLEFFLDDAAGRAAMLLLSFRLGPKQVEATKKMFEAADQLAAMKRS